MKKLFLSIIAVLMICMPSTLIAQQYVTDVILTSPTGIWTDNRAYATLVDAVSAIGTNEQTLVVASAQTVTSLTVPSNITLDFKSSGAINNSGVLNIQSSQIIAPSGKQIFTGTGDVDVANGTNVRSSWFGGLNYALECMEDNYAVLVVDSGWSGHVTANRTVGDNVTLKFEGAGNRIVINTGFTLSNIKNIDSGNYTIFGGSGSLNFLDGSDLNLSWFDTLPRALVYIGSAKANLKINESITLSTSETIPENINIQIEKGALISIDTGKTLTIYSPSNIIAQDNQQIFDCDSDGLSFSNTDGKVYPEWVGMNSSSADCSGSFLTAIKAANGAPIILSNKVYTFTNGVDVPDTVDAVTIIGITPNGREGVLTSGLVPNLHNDSATDYLLDFSAISDATPMTLQNFCINGNASTSGGGIYFNDFRQKTIKNLSFRSLLNPLDIGWNEATRVAAHYSVIDNISIKNCFYGIRVYGILNSTTLNKIQINGVEQYGIHLKDFGVSYIKNSWIEGCNAADDSGRALYAETGDYLELNNSWLEVNDGQITTSAVKTVVVSGCEWHSHRIGAGNWANFDISDNNVIMLLNNRLNSRFQTTTWMTFEGGGSAIEDRGIVIARGNNFFSEQSVPPEVSTDVWWFRVESDLSKLPRLMTLDGNNYTNGTNTVWDETARNSLTPETASRRVHINEGSHGSTWDAFAGTNFQSMSSIDLRTDSAYAKKIAKRVSLTDSTDTTILTYSTDNSANSNGGIIKLRGNVGTAHTSRAFEYIVDIRFYYGNTRAQIEEVFLGTSSDEITAARTISSITPTVTVSSDDVIVKLNVVTGGSSAPFNPSATFTAEAVTSVSTSDIKLY
jgi:hypothetical protein